MINAINLNNVKELIELLAFQRATRSIVISFVGNMLGLGILSIIYSLVVLIPGIAVGTRRLHDVGKSGWMQLVVFIPLIGIIWLIVLWAGEGDYGDNEYGANPEENFDY